jgi:hypothetical protein
MHAVFWVGWVHNTAVIICVCMQATPKALCSMRLAAGRPVMRMNRSSSRLVPRTASLEAPTGVMLGWEDSGPGCSPEHANTYTSRSHAGCTSIGECVALTGQAIACLFEH